jgi:hypothetical protein
VASLTSLICIRVAPIVPKPVILPNTIILLDVERGVIETLKPVTSSQPKVADVNVSVLAVLTTCNTLPAGNAAAAIVPVN